MADPRDILQRKFEPRDRFTNFGNVITKISIAGFRGHANTIIDIRSPITALCGLNGCGKSTVAELAAAAYRPAIGVPFQISTFFAVGPLDPAPFTSTAVVKYSYWQSDQTERTINIRRTVGSNWSGYRRRPERTVEFVSADVHVPRVERRDFVVREAARLRITATIDLDEVKTQAQRVLGQRYTAVQEKKIRRGAKRGEVLTASRGGVAYSEIHMGCGEGRVQSMIRRLEAVPDKSLIVLEEPESSLHQSAQFRFGRYLVDLAIRRGHQILLTTHSDFVLRALPQSSAVFLHLSASGLQPISSIPSMHAISLLTEGNAPAITVLVEDDCAQVVLAEIIRRIDPTFLGSVKIAVAGKRNEQGHTIGGGKIEIKTAMATIARAGLRVAAVLDGDATAAADLSIFKLPGTQAPEKEMLGVASIATLLQQSYGIVLADFLAEVGNMDHHRYLPELADRATVTVEHLTGELARVYAAQIPANDAKSLVDQIKDASST